MNALPYRPIRLPDSDRDRRWRAANRAEAGRTGMLAVLDAWTKADPGPAKDELLGLLLAQMAEFRSAVLFLHEVGAPRRGDLP